MLNQEKPLEKDRMFRYVVARLSSFGPCKLSQTKEALKEKAVESTGLTHQQFEDLFKDVQNQNGWDDINALAYFKTVVMF